MSIVTRRDALLDTHESFDISLSRSSKAGEALLPWCEQRTIAELFIETDKPVASDETCNWPRSTVADMQDRPSRPQ